MSSCPVSALTGDFVSNRTGTRGGCIPYFIHNNQLCFVFGQDGPSKDYTDFGGGVKNTDGSVLRAALREFVEETLGVFGVIYEQEIQDYLCCYNNDSLIIFLPMNAADVKNGIDLFHKRQNQIIDPEMIDMKIFNASELTSLLQSNNQSKFITFYEKTFDLLQEFDVSSLVTRKRSGSFDTHIPSHLKKSGGYR